MPSVETKLKVFVAIVLPSLLYGCETWTVYSSHARKLNHFHLSCLQNIMTIRWQDKIPDNQVLMKAMSVNVHTMLSKAQLSWSSHLVRMPEKRLPKYCFMESKNMENAHMGAREKDIETV